MAKRIFTLEYWRDDDWYVGRLVEAPGVFSQGQTLDDLKDNIEDAYRMMREETGQAHKDSQTIEIGVEV